MEDVAEELKVELPAQDYDTFGGYICSVIDRIPEDGESFTCDTEDLEIRVTGVENHRILEAVVRRRRRRRKRRNNNRTVTECKPPYLSRDAGRLTYRLFSNVELLRLNWSKKMEHTGLEPVTSTLPVWRAPNCANAP